MKAAIMQPYLFPYIGYFQLMNFVDKFTIYDDVNYITRGWINRNNILVNGRECMFTVPLKNASRSTLIKDLELCDTEKWVKKFLKTVKHSYSKAPYFDEISSVVAEVVSTRSKFIKDWHLKSFELINNYLDIKTDIIESSTIYNNMEFKGQYRILDICLKENIDHYINPIGGLKLYDRELFKKNEIEISYLKEEVTRYNQFKSKFVSCLSIIDVMMFNGKEITSKMLKNFNLV
ncbi:WbqC family protein [bacterium]|nr:WbqC family protein [bacterium]